MCYNVEREICFVEGNMVYCDLHTHTRFSFDGADHSTPDALCRRALEVGLTDLAITDHCDVNGEVEGLYDIYDADAAYTAVMEAKEKYRGRLNLLYGIELGNAHQYPDYARAALARHPYEFVIGSLHNLRDVPDFYYINFEKMREPLVHSLFSRALDETMEMCAFDVDGRSPFTAVGHITYMHRYVAVGKRTMDFKRHYDKLAALYELIIKRDIALELNVSTLAKGLGITMPTLELLKLYRDCGGRLVTTGSDAHCPEDIGRAIRKGHALLLAAGFDEVLTVRDGERVLQKIN
ncbi:MAG: histidinol-phosphatase HisJ family protein [Clostridia bacterium]|nr:histidinol-phosphatase HisJ family protein [Clostridia bacterium]